MLSPPDTVGVGTGAHLHVYVCIRHKIFSCGLNCSDGSVRLHCTGYYADRSCSVI